MLKVLKFHLRIAQDRMKQIADKHKSDRKFAVGDLVYVKLQSYKQVFVAARSNEKLAPKYFGPFPVIDTVGAVAYKLLLPAYSKIHNVFHVFQLKKHIGNAITSTDLPSNTNEVLAVKEPELIMDRMTVKRRGQAVTKVLVKWKHQLPEDATWEFYFDLCKKFPNFYS
ncbi:uncharacterized protein [Cicer arietinum]|uniref:uncharacterized protein n=1 Tax=Cicer arietinum TaxID=3827 RepID=UPI003CC6BF26